MSDFKSNPVDLSAHTDSSILQAFANANQQRLQAERQQNEFKQQEFQNKMQIANAVSNTVGQFAQAAVRRHIKNTIDAATQILSQPAPSQTVTPEGPTLPNEQGQETPMAPVANPNYANQMEQRRQATATLAENLAPEQLGSMAAQNILPKPVRPQLEPKQITYNGKPMMASFDKNTNTYYDNNNQPLKGNIEPYGGSSPLADVRKQTLIFNAGKEASKALDPANFSPNSLAGKSAAIVANADSALGLAQQMRNKEVPITQQNMTSLALDANRVLSQSSTSSEKITQELKAKTGFSTFKDALTYFTNHPQDENLQPFVDIITTEMQRQRDQRQKIVDRTLSGNLPSLNVLKKLAPDDWEQQIVANGFDLAEAKKGHLKIRPEIGSTMYGWNIGNSSNAPQPGNNAPQSQPQDIGTALRAILPKRTK